jgi:hypothetical protein
MSKPIVLIYDGHGSHNTVELIDAACTNNIILYLLPPHTTHHLQPCDVGAFGPLKRAWYSHCDTIYEKTDQHIQASDVVREYLAAHDESFKESTIQKAWSKSGIDVDEDGQPKCTPKIFTANDFAPSVSSSTQLNLPEGYPIDETNPSSSKAGSDDGCLTDSPDHSNSRPLTVTRHSKCILAHEPETELEIEPLPQLNSDPVSDSENDGDISETDEVVMSSVLKHRFAKLTSKAARYKHQCDEASAHAILAASHIHRLQGQLNAKTKKNNAGARNILVPSRVITTEEGRIEAQKQKEVRDARAQKEDERKQKNWTRLLRCTSGEHEKARTPCHSVACSKARSSHCSVTSHGH